MIVSFVECQYKMCVDLRRQSKLLYLIMRADVNTMGRAVSFGQG